MRLTNVAGNDGQFRNDLGWFGSKFLYGNSRRVVYSKLDQQKTLTSPMELEKCHSPPSQNDWTRWLDGEIFTSRINDLMDSFHVPGLAIAIISGSEIHSKAFGQASLDPPKPCTTDTIFDAASTSKALTAVSVALLKEYVSGSCGFQWNTPVCTLLRDDFVMSVPEATALITVEDILSHRAGLPGYVCTLYLELSE